MTNLFNFKWKLSAIIATLSLLVFMPSCGSDSKDDEPQNGESTGVVGKKLTEIKYTHGYLGITHGEDYGSSTTKIVYDAEGKVIGWKSGNSRTEVEWTEGMAKIVHDGDYKYYDALEFTNNLVSRTINIQAKEENTLSYNKAKRLSYYSYGPSVLTWDGDKLISVSEDLYDEEFKFDYSKGLKCKGFNPLPLYPDDDTNDLLDCSVGDIVSAMPNIFGISRQSLPNSAVHYDYKDNYDIKYEYEYTFTNDGYVKSCKVSHLNYAGETYVRSFEFEWE